MPINHVSQDHLTTESVKGITALKMHSPTVLTLQETCQDSTQ